MIFSAASVSPFRQYFSLGSLRETEMENSMIFFLLYIKKKGSIWVPTKYEKWQQVY